MKLLEEHTGINLQDLGFSDGFLIKIFHLFKQTKNQLTQFS